MEGAGNFVGLDTSNPLLYNGRFPPQTMDDALTLLPTRDKLALLQACMVCPDVVEQESPPNLFLQFEDYNYFAAAARWAKYWDVRLNLFGPERAFLCVLDLSGNGALQANLVEYIATGVAVILPPDDQQRPVLFTDRSRLPSEYLHWPNDNRVLLAFAMLQKLMLLSPNFIIVFLSTNRPRFFPGVGTWFSDAIRHAFPLKPPTIYVVCRSTSSTFKSFVATYIPVFLRLMNHNFRQYNITIDIGEKEELLKKLVRNGLHSERLPESVGGSWTYEGYDEWLRTQRLDRSHSSTPQHLSREAADSHGLQFLAAAIESEPRTNHDSQLGKNYEAQDFHCGTMLSTTERKSTDEVGFDPAFQTSIIDGSKRIENVIMEIANMPFHEKFHYCEALKISPQLEAAEAKLDTFLILEKGNVEAAAKRVVSYWNLRTQLFRDRAFLPLNQLDADALNSDDLRTLKCGYITLLPENKKSCRVLCCDASRLEKDDEESRLRCFLYMLHVASANGSGHEGVTILLVMNKLSFDRTCGHRLLAPLLAVVPAKISAIHIIRQPARLGVALFEAKVVPAIKGLFQALPTPIHAHVGSPSCDLCEDLSSHGFDNKSLPRSIGGGWTYQDFLQWRSQRMITEGMSRLQLNQNTTDQYQGLNGPTPSVLTPHVSFPFSTSRSSIFTIATLPVPERYPQQDLLTDKNIAKPSSKRPR